MAWLCLITAGLALWFAGATGWIDELGAILRRGRRRPARRRSGPWRGA
jgi:hypothetical protein